MANRNGGQINVDVIRLTLLRSAGFARNHDRLPCCCCCDNKRTTSADVTTTQTTSVSKPYFRAKDQPAIRYSIEVLL